MSNFPLDVTQEEIDLVERRLTFVPKVVNEHGQEVDGEPTQNETALQWALKNLLPTGAETPEQATARATQWFKNKAATQAKIEARNA